MPEFVWPNKKNFGSKIGSKHFQVKKVGSKIGIFEIQPKEFSAKKIKCSPVNFKSVKISKLSVIRLRYDLLLLEFVWVEYFFIRRKKSDVLVIGS